MQFRSRRLQGQAGLRTTKGFEMKWKMLQNLVRSRKRRKAVSKKERKELHLS